MFINLKRRFMNSPKPKNRNTETDTDRLSGKRNDTDNAREEAMEDIEKDADLNLHSPNDELDEGETARIGENTDLV